jgi:hypothetical protein
LRVLLTVLIDHVPSAVANRLRGVRALMVTLRTGSRPLLLVSHLVSPFDFHESLDALNVRHMQVDILLD